MAKVVTGVALAAGAVALAVTPGLQFMTPFMMHALAGSLLSMGASMTMGGVAEELRGGPGYSGSIRQPAAARQCVYGQNRVSGTVLYTNTTGHQLNQIIAWASHSIQSIDAIYLDGREFHGTPWFTSNSTYYKGDGATYQDPSGNNYSFGSEVFVGNQALGSSSGFWYQALYDQNYSYWDSSNMLKGIAASYLKLAYDSNKFSGSPNIKATIHGRNDIYDPRTGLTGYSNNAALVIANFLCDATWGIGCSMSEVDQTQLIAAANICDEAVTLASGGTEKRYTINGFFDTNSAPADILDSMLMACAGRISYSGGKWKIYPGAWYGTSLAFDEGDLTDKIQWTATRKYRDRCNAVRGTFVCPCYPYEQTGYDKDHKNPNIFSGEWQPADVPEYAQDSLHGYVSDVNVAQDGGVKLYNDIRLQFVTSVGQAQRLAKIYLLRNRYMGSGHLSMNLSAYQTCAQDVIQVTAPALSWTNKYLEVQQTHLVPHMEQGNPSITVELDVVETGPDVFSWSTAEERGVQDTPSPTLDIPSSVDAPTNLTLTDDSSTAIMQQDGTSMARMLVSWTPPNDPFVTTGGHIQIQYQLNTRHYVVTPIWSLLGTISNGDGSYSTGWVDCASVSGNANNYYIDGIDQYEGINVRIRSVRANGATSSWVTAVQSGYHVWNRPVPIISTSTTRLNYGDGTSIETWKPAQPGADVTGQNAQTLVLNPNFLAGNTGWTFANSSLQAGSGWNGSGYYGVVNAASNSYISNTQKVYVSAGTVLTASCYASGVNGANGSTAAVNIGFFNASGTWLTTSFGNNAASGAGWQPSRIVATAPANAAYCLIGFQVMGGSTGQWNVGGFMASILANSLDEVPDSSTYRRVSAVHVTGGGTLQYSSGGTIDSLKPAEGGAEKTTGKSIDLLTDGSTYARTIVGRVNSGRPVIDFSEGIHANKTLDYVGDGSTYARIKASGLSGGGINYASGTHTGLLPRGNHCADVTNTLLTGGGIDFSSTLHSNSNLVRNNLIDCSWWSPGATILWSQNKSTSSVANYFTPATMPDGSSRIVWHATTGSGDGAGQGGGWASNDSIPTESFPVDTAKSYLYACYFRSISGPDGTAYWGPTNGNDICDLNTTNVNGNPYFAYVGRASMVASRWYLFIGWVYPAGSTGMSNGLAGIWDCVTGKQIVNGTSYCWNAGVTRSSMRAYQFYATSGNMQFSNPQVYVCDGREPSVQSLLSFAAISGGNPITASNYSTSINSGAIPVDHLSDGTNYARVPRTIFGGPNAVISPVGNFRLKNLLANGWVTINPTLSTSGFADLPELGSGNPAMTVTTQGNPILTAANLAFYAASGTSSSGPVSGIGTSFSPYSVTLDNYDGPPNIAISISGNGSGASASVAWNVSFNQSTQVYTVTPTLTVVGGSNYTSATAQVVITNGDGIHYVNGTYNYTCTISMATPVSGAAIQVRILMDGVTVVGPIQITSDSKGMAYIPMPLSLEFPLAAAHSFRVQAYNLSTATVTSTNREFQLVELG